MTMLKQCIVVKKRGVPGVGIWKYIFLDNV
jgi:hypothetical protein